MKIKSVLIASICIASIFFFSFSDTEPYKNNTLSVDERVEDLLSRMSLSEKLTLLQGTGGATVGIEKFNIPSLQCSDGPAGAHRNGAATFYPCANSLGASWDISLINKVATAIGSEANAKNIQILLGPGINIIRHPLCGRNFEYYSEDPYLTGRLAVAFTKGLQSEKVVATLKHFAANNQEFYRNSVDVIVDERALQEIYLPAFKDAVTEGNAWSVMSAYNKVNGIYCSENKYLLTDMLKNNWGFKGFVMPDWAGAHSTAPSANAGLDCIIYKTDLFGAPLAEAVKNGLVSEATITEMARRVLRVIFLTGMMDKQSPPDLAQLNSKAHQELNRKAAREGIVLLKNKNNILPIQSSKVKKLAVIGPNAAKLRMGGGGSSYIENVFYKVTPLEGITKAAGNHIKVAYAQGASIADTLIPIGKQYLKPSNTFRGKKGLWAEYYNNMDLKGSPTVSQLDTTVDFVWQAGPTFYLTDKEQKEKSKIIDKTIGNDYFSARWSGTVTPPETGYYDFVTHCDDGVRLYVNDKLIIDQWFNHDKEFRYGTIRLEAGKPYKIKLEYYEAIGGATIRLGWYYHDPKLIDEAVALAKKSDAVVICAGIDRFWEAEGADRTDFELPLIQNELIKAVSAVNPNVIVVLNNGGPLNVMPWINNVSGLVEAWFTGNEGGNAIADVLFGSYNPSGKLPFSYVQNKSEFPPAFDNYLNRDEKAVYKEGIYVGYRYHDKNNTKLMFPFGFGLSYTTFEYSNLRIENVSDQKYIAHFDVKNTGKVDGTEIAQLYVSELKPSIDRPVKELKGFQKILIRRNETKTFDIPLNASQLGFFDPTAKAWKLNKGKYMVQVGSSSVEMKLKGEIEL
ncbi:MAG: glycoside hydrolase family 3 C-terminal domain-containing protein [Bacteroidales bacterium]|nr:glycoside hydrolase family 3 C-terminal domain-containing protein [Bacteroidales bacterium]